MMHPIIFQNVSKSYNGKAALRDIEFAIPQNSITAIIGPSGSGKSTLLQHINGLLRPDSGVVKIFDEAIDYERLLALRKRIGYAVQGTGLFPHLTIKKNITLLARLEKWDESELEDRTRKLMSLVDLPLAYGGRYPHELSGGEQQRVGLCRAMMLRPPIFLLDEAFGALDPITRSEIHHEFTKLQRTEPRTTVLVTHDLREAFKLGETVVILNEGRIEQIGSRDEILQRPANGFVEKFVHLQLEDDIFKK